MLYIEGKNLKKHYGDHFSLEAGDLNIYSQDRIGIVGANGAGKTTLINLLCGRLEPDEGWVRLHGSFACVSQTGRPDIETISGELASLFNIKEVWDNNMSGGEKSKFKVAAALSSGANILFADEPTSNVDIDGRELMEKLLAQYRGALVIISHDRSFLDKLCNTVWEIEKGKIKIYPGNYSNYRQLKDKETLRAQREYEEYVKEKKRLEKACQETRLKIQSIKGTPKRMGNSEARLHKMGDQSSKAKLSRRIKNIEKRIEKLAVKEKPKKVKSIKLDLTEIPDLSSRIILRGENLNKSYGNKVILKDAAFTLQGPAKVALIGPNGCGKTTLIKMIVSREGNIQAAPGAKIGYFSQDMDILDEKLTVLENATAESIHPDEYARRLLARLGFREKDVNKTVDRLSGGERVKLSFAKVLLQDINLLILDEPTNYLDMNSLEAIEDALITYEGNLLFVSHDRHLINSVADHIMTIRDGKIYLHKGTYQEFIESQRKPAVETDKEIREMIAVWENRLADVIGRLSQPGKNDNIELLNQSYQEILGEIKLLKAKINSRE